MSYFFYIIDRHGILTPAPSLTLRGCVHTQGGTAVLKLVKSRVFSNRDRGNLWTFIAAFAHFRLFIR